MLSVHSGAETEGAREEQRHKKEEKKGGKGRMKSPLLTRSDPHTFAQLFWGSGSLGNRQPL